MTYLYYNADILIDKFLLQHCRLLLAFVCIKTSLFMSFINSTHFMFAHIFRRLFQVVRQMMVAFLRQITLLPLRGTTVQTCLGAAVL